MASSPTNWSDHLDYVALSDVGMRRGNNQDAFAVHLASDKDDWAKRGHIFLVADGMGAHAAGELASKMAADGIPHTYLMLAKIPPAEAIVQAVQQNNAMIHARGTSSPDFSGMGTTCSLLILVPQGAIVAHAGDSRVYRLRGKKIEQLTFDHSLLWEMRATGNLSSDALANLVPKNIITRSLGPNAQVKVDVEGPFPLVVGDTFLLCSDGLSGQVTDAEMGAILSCLSPAEAAQGLIDLANLRGGPDNITVLIAKIKSEQMTQAAEPLLMKPARPQNEQKFPLPLAIAASVALLVALATAGMGMWIVAAGALGIAAVCGLIGLGKKYSGRHPEYLSTGAAFGKGPYVSSDATPTAAVVDALAVVVKQLRDAAQREQWPVQWAIFNQHLNRAQSAAGGQDRAGAVREYVRAMSYMLVQLRKANVKRPAKGSDELVL